VTFSCFVAGTPRPQGSMSLWRGGGGKEIARYPDRVTEWRNLLHFAFVEEMRGRSGPILGAVELRLLFRLARPRVHFRTGRHRALLRDAAPEVPTAAPDLDKLVRAVADALTTARVWEDDGQVALICAGKVYACPPEEEGVQVRVIPL